MEVDKKLVKHLAELSRIDLEDTDALVKDFNEIVSYFGKLSELDVEGVLPMDGGNLLENVFREDELKESKRIPRDNSVEQFPESKDGYNKIPPVF